MNTESRISFRTGTVVAGVVALIAAGSLATFPILRFTDRNRAPESGVVPGGATAAPAARPPSTALPPGSASAADVAITLSAEAVKRAGIMTATATAGRAEGVSLYAPGIVEPNGYRTVVVTPLVSGRLIGITPDLGTAVRKGQVVAQVFSPELADAQTRYISGRAELEAHERELARTESLVKIGAASREELERVHATHTARSADVEAAASRLELLGLLRTTIDSLASGKPVASIVDVSAPIDGIVTERTTNAGTNVDQGSKLMTIVDLSNVWIVANIYERDFSKVRVGSSATVTTKAYPDFLVRGRVSYIDPQVNSDTRTAKVRVEVPNPRQQLRLGMYADVAFAAGAANTAGDAAVMIPRAAVQQAGDLTVVYLVDSQGAGRFTERPVRLGPGTGEQVAVLDGLQSGDVVVASGSFFLRAERDRLGLGQRQSQKAATESQTSSPQTALTSPPMTGDQMAEVQNAKITVGEQGFEPATLNLRAAVPARITFVRTTDNTCATEIVFPSLKIKRALPLTQPVVIEFTPPKTGEVVFVCGMNMLKGSVVIVP